MEKVETSLSQGDSPIHWLQQTNSSPLNMNSGVEPTAADTKDFSRRASHQNRVYALGHKDRSPSRSIHKR